MLSLFNAAAPDGGGPHFSYGLRRARLDLILGDPQYSRWFASTYAGIDNQQPLPAPTAQMLTSH